MVDVYRATFPDDACRPHAASDAPPLDDLSETFAHFVAMRDGACVGRCSHWTKETPVLDGQPVGVIGHYAASDGEAGAALLKHVAAQLADAGFRRAVGPMDGSTWRRYRLLTDRGSEPPFFLEPDNPDRYVADFAAAGFSPLAHYSSAVVDDLSAVDPRLPSMMARIESAGVRVRPIDLRRYDQELAMVYELAVAAFADNFLYTPIERAEFLALYTPLRELLRPELVLLAEQHDRLVGFMFAVPNVLEASRGETVRTLIAKSLAVHPDLRGIGLGGVLMNLLQQAARRSGFERIIHALMHETNASRKISAHNATTIRRYTLFAKELP